MKKYLFLTVILALGFTACKNETNTNAKNEKVEIPFKKEGVLQLKKAKTDSLITTLDIEIAKTDYETQTGLMYRTKLGKNQGMLFIFPDEQMRFFYMKNTKIPLDIIYINASNAIVSFQKNAQPFNENSLPSEAPAQYVLEVNAGLANQWQLEVGDVVTFKEF